MLDPCRSCYGVLDKTWRVDNCGKETLVYPFFGSENQQFCCANPWAIGEDGFVQIWPELSI